MSSISCPRCNLINPPSTSVCDCGFFFSNTLSSLPFVQTLRDYPAPGLLPRLGSALIDGLLLLPFLVLGDLVKIDLGVITSLFLVYRIVTLTLFSQTLGMRLLKLYFSTLEKTKPRFSGVLIQCSFAALITLLEIIAKAMGHSEILNHPLYFVLSVVLCGAQLISFYSSPQRQFLEDRLAGTRFYFHG